jgi:hypothetical protein
MLKLELIGRKETLEETKQLYSDSFSLKGWDEIKGWLNFDTSVEGLRQMMPVLKYSDYFDIGRIGTDKKMSLVEKAYIRCDVKQKELKIELGPQWSGEVEKGVERTLGISLLEDHDFKSKKYTGALTGDHLNKMADVSELVGSADKAAHPLYISVHIGRAKLDLPWNLTSSHDLHVNAIKDENSQEMLDVQLSIYPAGLSDLDFFYEHEPDPDDPKLKYFMDAARQFGMPTLPSSWVDVLEYLEKPRTLSEVAIKFPEEKHPEALLYVMSRDGIVSVFRDSYKASESKIVAALGGYKRRAE